MRLLAAILLLPGLAAAQFTASGDQTVTGAMGAGTAAPRARLEAALTTADAYALKISSQNGAPLFVVDRFGKVGIASGVPQALWDVPGSDAADDIGLQLRAGNSSSTYSSSQLVFGYGDSGAQRHSLRTRHAAGQYWGNSLDFFLWRSTDAPSDLGEMGALSLQAWSASSSTVHVRPSTGTPAYELVVSDGYTLGAGAVMAATVGSHSSRDIKDIEGRLGADEEARAYADVNGLRHAVYRYRNQPLTRGLIYEDAPDSVREPRGRSIVFEARLNNMEMALKVALGRIRALENEISTLEREDGR